MALQKGMKMAKKKDKSVADRILEIGSFLQTLKSAEEIKAKIKDSTGYNIKMADLRVNLLYLLRREKIKREKVGQIYKYHIQS